MWIDCDWMLLDNSAPRQNVIFSFERKKEAVWFRYPEPVKITV